MKTATLEIREVRETPNSNIIHTKYTVTGAIAGLTAKETELVAQTLASAANMLFVNGEQNAQAIARKRVMRAPYIEFLLDHFRMDDETLENLQD